LCNPQACGRTGDVAFLGNRALEVLDLTVRRESFVLAFSEAFTLLGVILLAAIPLVWFVWPRRKDRNDRKDRESPDSPAHAPPKPAPASHSI
jgi:heme/copper-type cytochrome/quinol oxidase subunit 2